MNAVLVIILASAVLWAVLHMRHRLHRGGGCCGDKAPEVKRIRKADRNKAHYPYAVRLLIGGMTCENCARTVENAINGVEGYWASVSISEHSASVLCKTEPDEVQLRDIVRKAGYVVTDFQRLNVSN